MKRYFLGVLGVFARKHTFYETINLEWEKMKKQTHDLEERLLEYSVRINHGD